MKLFVGALAFFLMVSSYAGAADPPPATGVWLTEDHKAHIKIEACGTDLCGTIIWLAEPLYPDTGTPKIDKNNPDETLRQRPVMGMKIFQMKMDPDGLWHGDIYSAQDGNTYDANIHGGGDKLYLHGCILFGVLCKTQTWVPVSE